MADEPQARPRSNAPLHEIPYLQLFPWLRIFQCAGAATDPKRLMLAAAGVLLSTFGWKAIDSLFPGTTPTQPDPRVLLFAVEPLDLMNLLTRLTEPFRLMVDPLLAILNSPSSFQESLHFVLAGLWALLVWGILGGAIARIAVLKMARGERLTMRGALRFAIRKGMPMVGGPLIPVSGLVLFALGIGLFGLLYRIPGPVGQTIAGIFAFLPLLGGLLLTLIVIGLVLGWPLMPTSIAVEEEDGFDAVSRAYAYIHQRPWHYGIYTALALVVGLFGLVYVTIFAALVIRLTAWGLSVGGPPATIAELFQFAPNASNVSASGIHALWMSAIGLLVRGWVYSYFWTVATAIYLLLRLDIDGTPWSKVQSTPFVVPVLAVAADLPVASTSIVKEAPADPDMA